MTIEEFQKTGDKNLFEEVIDKMMLDNFDEKFREKIMDMSKSEKRMAILSLLDKDRNLFMKIRSLVTGNKVSKTEHLRDVILMLREYVKVGEIEKKKFGEVMTDISLAKHILSKIPKEDFSDPTKTFIDLSNGTGVFPLVILYRLMMGLKESFPNEEERYKHIVENQIFVSEIQPKNMFLYMCLIDPYDEYDLNIYCGSSLEDGFKNHMKNVWGKTAFSYSVGNPPFNQMIDMKFVRLSYEIADVTCIVHPSTWLLDEKGKQRAFTDTKDLIKDHLESIELFNGNQVFNIGLFVPCVITYINKNKISDGIKCIDKINNIELTYNNINQINKYSNTKEYFTIKQKIESRSTKDNLLKHKNVEYGNHFVNSAQIRGHVYISSNLSTINKMVQDDFYTLVTRDLKISNEKNTNMFFSFNTDKEASNFLAYLRKNFTRFCLSIFKNNQNLHRGELEIIPWLDFSQEWADEKLYKEFNLTGEEIKFIEKHIPKYY